MVFNAPHRSAADTYLTQVVQKYAKTASKLADWIEKNIPDGLTVFVFPASHQRRLRTTNGLERLNREICAAPTWWASFRMRLPACASPAPF